MSCVLARVDDRILSLQQHAQQRDRLRRRADQHPRGIAKRTRQPQGKLHHVPNSLCVGAGRHLIKPAAVEVRAAKPLRFLGAKQMRHRAVRPDDAPGGRLVGRTIVRWRRRQDAARTLDLDLAQRVGSRADDPEIAPPAAFDLGTAPLGGRPRLARSSPTHQQPGTPIASRGHLVRPCPERPGVFQRRQLGESHLCQDRAALVLRQGCQPNGRRDHIHTTMSASARTAGAAGTRFATSARTRFSSAAGSSKPIAAA